MAGPNNLKGSNMSGPIRAKRMSNGLSVTGRSATVTVTALTASTAEVYTITDADAQVGDVITVSPNVAPEAGWGIICAWVDAAGSIKVKAFNFDLAQALTGGSLVLNYTITR